MNKNSITQNHLFVIGGGVLAIFEGSKVWGNPVKGTGTVLISQSDDPNISSIDSLINSFLDGLSK